jgi:hypothetical protein
MHPEERTEVANPISFYPLENEKYVPFCQPDEYNDKSEDPRYHWTGGEVNEFEVQQDSGVFETLMSLPLYSKYTGNDIA